MEFSIRNANESDVPGILGIVNHAILHTTANYNYAPQLLADQQLWFAEKTKKNNPILVADYDGKVIGFSTYGTFREKIGYQFTVEHSVYVADGFSGNGIGKALLQKLISVAKEQGYHNMIGGIDASNSGSIAFHKKFGFEECGIIKDAAFKFDRWLDLMFMQLLLDR
ncbi:MAG: N-acetyltransferase family protein [Flavobacterium sp.]|uniref:GNAT family N-acetyltransferase n=1 Tax=Flavobacterium sp. TaxID=239 RepID=UPI00120B3916|nr:GNAT family N-acetyltransferase [Flavobacterium sp.]RZJ68301.1 MAG: N-acetyltransferase family protein [Flavobacterium sp.]